MTTASLPIVDPTQAAPMAEVILVGNPNAGKTSLFNRLTGLRGHTANFAGTTVEHRRGRLERDQTNITIVDLPGMYSLTATTPEEEIACQVLRGQHPGVAAPHGVVIVVDATNLERNLPLAAEVIDLGTPVIVALNMSDLADRLGLKLNTAKLSERLGCPVVRVSARTGTGIEGLSEAIHCLAEQQTQPADQRVSVCGSCHGCGYASRFTWAESVRREALSGDLEAPARLTDALDRVLTHSLGGPAVFAAAMLLTFMTIFSFASVPMDAIDATFGWLSEQVGSLLPEGDLNSLVVDGVIAGVGGTVIFLPQIFLLFFLLALLEGSGYLSRAAFVMDRLMRRVGLPGQAFVPMLSAHACAIPAIMATRIIESRRDRLATILVAPLASCSARVPVYVMVVAMLFPGGSWGGAALFAGAYILGLSAALLVAWVLKKTVLQGESRPLVIELPNYRLPSFRGALSEALDRSWVFLKTAGTTILTISIILWALATYPKTSIEDLPEATQTHLASLDEETAEVELAAISLERSAAGRIGKTVEPVFAPLGFDWKITVGVVTSFAAREVVVSTLSILYGLGEEGSEDTLLEALRSATDSSGAVVFTTPTSLSLLVFFVLAMQCLPTQAVTKRETGSWGWALFQLAYMSLLAYGAAWAVRQVALAAGL